MNRLSFTLLLLLTVSVGLNIYQYNNGSNKPETSEKSVVQTSVPFGSKPSQPTIANPRQTQPRETSTQNQNKSDLAEALFHQGKYYEAIALYVELLQEDEQAAAALHEYWRDIIKNRVLKDELLGVWPFLTAFLDSYPFDLKMLTLKAEALAKSDKIVEAIETYYTLLSNSYEIKEEEYFQARIRHLARERIDLLVKQGSWQAALDFVEIMLQQESTFPPYLLSQAEAMIELGQMENAEAILLDLLNNSYYRESAQKLLSRIEKVRLQQTAIKLQAIGEHYLVSGIVDRESRVSLMIDTGASLSVLTQERFDQLQSWSVPEFMGETLLNTAGGQVTAPIYQFERFQIDEFFVDKMNFVVLPIEGVSNYDGLLGMNFLKHFKFEIDQENNLFILSP